MRRHWWARSWCFPVPGLDGASLYELFESRAGDTLLRRADGVARPHQLHEAERLRFSTLERTIIGGAACPPAMMRTLEDEFGVAVIHGWGMTEMSPVGTVNTPEGKACGMPRTSRQPSPLKQGRAVFGVDMRIVDGEGVRAAAGTARLRRPAGARARGSCASYSGTKAATARRDGWFPTGDVAHHRPRRLPADHRPQQGRDQVGRRMDQLDRAGEHRDRRTRPWPRPR